MWARACATSRRAQRVMLQPGLSCGRCEACLAGADNFCAQYDVLGYQSAGGYAEHVAVPAGEPHSAARRHRLRRGRGVPARVPHRVAHAGHARAADRARHRARARRGQRRRTGRRADRAVARGARVIATAGGAEKSPAPDALGADEVVDHYNDDVVAARESAHRRPRRGRRRRARRRGDLGRERALPRARRPARDVRRDDGPRRAARSPAPVRAAAVAPRLLHGREGASCCGRRSCSSGQRSVRSSIGRFPLSEAAQAPIDISKHREQFGKVVLTI